MLNRNISPLCLVTTLLTQIRVKFMANYILSIKSQGKQNGKLLVSHRQHHELTVTANVYVADYLISNMYTDEVKGR